MIIQMTRLPNFRTRTIGVALTALLLAGSATGARAQAGSANPISVSANALRRSTYGALLPNTEVKPETRSEKLEITLKNTTEERYSNLTVRCCIFEKELQSHKVTVALHQELPIALPGKATVIITSEVARVVFTAAHELTTRQRSLRRGEPDVVTVTPVKAAGQEFAGYGIEVRQANLDLGQLAGPHHSTNLVLGRLFSGRELTNQFAAAFAGPAPAE